MVDRWLKGIDNGVDREPPIALFAQRSTLPAPDRAEVRGEWRYEPTWPADRLMPAGWRLRDAKPTWPDLSMRSTFAATSATRRGSPARGAPVGQPDDQRPDELHLTYTWEPLEQELEILGHARLLARVTSTAPVAFLSAKLCDVFPDGTSSLVARGMLNLTHRASRDHPSPLAPGEPVDVELMLEVTSWTFEPGHRVRLDLAGTDWPNAWSPPAPVTLTIDREATALELPVMDGPHPSERSGPSTSDPRRPGRGRRARPAGGVRWSVTHEALTRITSANAGSTFEDDATLGVPRCAATTTASCRCRRPIRSCRGAR